MRVSSHICISFIKEEIIFSDLLQTLSEVKNTFEFNQSLSGCKFIFWNVVRLLTHFGWKVAIHTTWYKKNCGFLMFSGGIEREHLLHFLITWKRTLQISWPEKIRISGNSSYTINWKFFLIICYKETIKARILV